MPPGIFGLKSKLRSDPLTLLVLGFYISVVCKGVDETWPLLMLLFFIRESEVRWDEPFLVSIYVFSD